MKILTTAQIREWDAFTILNEPIKSIDLMERAAKQAYALFTQQMQTFLPEPSNNIFAVFCGQGNNGGDGLVFARMLQEAGFNAQVYVLKLKQKGSIDFEIQLQKTIKNGVPLQIIDSPNAVTQISTFNVCIDAIFGSGLTKNLDGLAKELIDFLNNQKGYKISIDIPSGLFGDIDLAIRQENAPVFVAHQTYTFQIPKSSFLFAETGKAVGELFIIDIGLLPHFLSQIQSNWTWLNEDNISNSAASKFDYKWQKGHALLITGSRGKLGAAILSSTAALRAACGLLTVFSPNCAYAILQTSLPEAMVLTDVEENEIRNFPATNNYQAIGVGPGIGIHAGTIKSFGKWLSQIKQAIVLDADAINACASLRKENPAFQFPPNCIITPHHKEFDRLFGPSKNSLERLNLAIEMAEKYQIVIVLKGAYTAIISSEKNVYFNSTGHPLLATAGSGDVLTGIVTAYLANGLLPLEAAIKAVFVHGNLAQSLHLKNYKHAIASDLIDELKFFV